MSHNLEAEQAILGSIILNNHYFYQASILKPDDFGEIIHEKLFQHLLDNIDTQTQNKITLQEFFKANKMLDYLHVLLCSAENLCFRDYVLTVKTLSNTLSTAAILVGWVVTDPGMTCWDISSLCRCSSSSRLLICSAALHMP